ARGRDPHPLAHGAPGRGKEHLPVPRRRRRHVQLGTLVRARRTEALRRGAPCRSAADVSEPSRCRPPDVAPQPRAPLEGRCGAAQLHPTGIHRRFDVQHVRRRPKAYRLPGVSTLPRRAVLTKSPWLATSSPRKYVATGTPCTSMPSKGVLL